MKHRRDNIFSFKGRLKDSYLQYNSLWLLLFVIGMGFFLIGMPKYGDDYWYLAGLSRWLAAHGVTLIDQGVSLKDILLDFPMAEIEDTMSYHFYYDNSRIANMAGLAALFFPKWVGSGITLIAWIAAIWGSFRLANINWRRSALVPVAIFIWLFMLGWGDQMGSIIFQYNYIVGAGIGILFSCMVFFSRRGNLQLLLLFLLAILTGGWHEGFSLPIFCGLLAILIIKRGWRERKPVVGITGLAIGACVLLICTKYQLIITGNFQVENPHSLHNLVTVFSLHPALWLMLCVWGACSLREHRIVIPTGDLEIFMLVSLIVSILISFITTLEQRVGWWADMMSVTLILSMLQRYFPSIFSHYNKRSIAISAVLLPLSFWRLGMADITAVQYRRELHRIVREMDTSPKENVYIDYIDITDKPFIRGELPDKQMMQAPIAHWTNTYFIEQRSDTTFLKRIIPQQFRNLKRGMGTPLPSNKDVRIIGGAMYVPYDSTLEARIDSYSTSSYNVIYEYAGGIRQSGIIQGHLFRSEGDGEEYLWLTIQIKSWALRHFLPPKRITFIGLNEGDAG